MDRIDLALEAAVDQVLHHRVADLAVLGRRADYRDRSGTHDPVHRAQDFLARGPKALAGRREIEQHADVERRCADGPRQYRVEIDLGDFRKVGGKNRDRFDNRRERALVDRGRAAHAAQNFGRRDPVDHRERVLAARRRQAKRDVLEHFDQHAAQPEGHHLAEARIVRGADYHFLTAGEHLLDFDSCELRVRLVRARAGDDLFIGPLGLGRALHVEHHASRLGLVQDVG